MGNAPAGAGLATRRQAGDWVRGQPIRLENVGVQRAEIEILRGISLTLEPGRRHVILGASGSGKSTLVRLFNRLDDPDSGQILVGDLPLSRFPILELRRRIGLVMQSPRPLLGSLGDNLAYPFAVRQELEPDRDQRTTALAEVGLDPDWIDRDAASLSGGERQRLAIAVALGMKPEILILDEPTAALDPASARGIADLLDHRARTEGLRTIVVTHDRGLAPNLGAWGIRLDRGTVADSGPIRDVLARADEADGQG